MMEIDVCQLYISEQSPERLKSYAHQKRDYWVNH